MKIDERTQPIPLNTYRSLAGGQSEANQIHQTSLPGSPGDKVNLSAHSRIVQQAARALKQMPEVRQGLVGKVKTAVESGTYRVDSEKAARGMLKEAFENEIIMRKIDVMA